jgi:hypothetical protein
MSIGEKKNPQDLVNIELASVESGFLSPDHKKNFVNHAKGPSTKRPTEDDFGGDEL